jgi:hypothetical protein
VVDYICVFNEQIECAVNRLLHLNADWMCSKIQGLLRWMQSGCADWMCRLSGQIRRAFPFSKVFKSERVFRRSCTQCRKKTNIKMDIKNVCTDLQTACRCAAQIDRGFYCTCNLHSNTEDGLRHMQYAHWTRKCNRPLSRAHVENFPVATPVIFRPGHILDRKFPLLALAIRWYFQSLMCAAVK